MRSQLVLAIAAFLLLELPQKAIAHGVNVDYQARQGFEISAAYDTGEPMANAQVSVFSPENPSTPWQTATTDAEGRFRFVPTTAGNWQIKIQQAGHGSALTIPVRETSAAEPIASASSAAAEQPAHSEANSPAPTAATSASPSPLQKGVMVGSVLWGCVGTALFFWRTNKRQQPQN